MDKVHRKQINKSDPEHTHYYSIIITMSYIYIQRPSSVIIQSALKLHSHSHTHIHPLVALTFAGCCLPLERYHIHKYKEQVRVQDLAQRHFHLLGLEFKPLTLLITGTTTRPLELEPQRATIIVSILVQYTYIFILIAELIDLLFMLN